MKSGKYLLLLAGVIFGLALYFAPQQLSNEAIQPEISALDSKIDRAVALVNAGEKPMEGIMLLREVLEEDSENIQAHFQLGIFSVRSNQFEKAIERFEKVLSLNPELYDAHYYLGFAHYSMKHKEEALKSFEIFVKNTKEESRRVEVNEFINELKTQ